MIRILFEDEKFVNLLPLVYFRPVWELICGKSSLREKIVSNFEGDWQELPREMLDRDHQQNKWFKALSAHEDVLLVNGRWIPDRSESRILDKLSPESILVRGESLLAARLNAQVARSFFQGGICQSQDLIREFPATDIDANIIDYPWQLVSQNGHFLTEDWHRLATPQIMGEVHKGVHLLNPDNITIASDVSIQPGVVIDAQEGPVWIDEGATIMANSVLKGPLFIGKNSTIKIAAKIYENTTIGPVCKIGGEVEGSIIQGYSNKQHDGFLGHAYLGSWVNLGADTNNSDLKNNYGNVSVQLNGHTINTGERFVGLIMGDHSKSGINAMFNTGTIIGVSCNVFGAGLPPKFVPSFSWGGEGGLSLYHFEKAKAVAATVMSRRKVEFDQFQEDLFASAWNLAAEVENGSLLTN